MMANTITKGKAGARRQITKFVQGSRPRNMRRLEERVEALEEINDALVRLLKIDTELGDHKSPTERRHADLLKVALITFKDLGRTCGMVIQD